MKKTLISLIIIALFGVNYGICETITVSGDVSGIWDVDTVLVTGEIRVPPNETLVIESGVKVLFQVCCQFIVDSDAVLLAEGTEEEWILFDEYSPGTGWYGINFIGASDLSILHYCHITHGLAQTGQDGGGISCYNSSPTISRCLIDSCSAGNGGGISCVFFSHPSIKGNIITGNTATGAWGGGIYMWNSDAVINDNIILNNQADFGGGGISSDDESPTISNNLILSNSAYTGGGILCQWNTATLIENNIISGNSCDIQGGAIFYYYSGLDIRNNIMTNNSAADGGGALYSMEGGGYTINGNVICQNSTEGMGAGIVWQHASTPIDKNTIVHNIASIEGGGISLITNSDPPISNSILYSNVPEQINAAPASDPTVSYCDVQDGWPGIGNINADPLFVDPLLHDYRLQWGSPCIDSGDPDPQYNDPDGTRADMGAFYYDQSMPVRILLTPHEIPYLIEETGGTMDYTIRVTNIDASPQIVTAWCDITLPDSSVVGPILGPVTVTVPPGVTIDRIRTQTIPGNAPFGVYHYNAYAVVGADTSKDSFMWGKLGTAVNGSSDWSNCGEPFSGPGVVQNDDQQPEKPFLSGCYPNPFNPTITISFHLPVASDVRLDVFDINGRTVGARLPRPYSPGHHEITFDGSELSSGIYVYRLTAGKVSRSGATPTMMFGKMALMK